MVTSWNWAAPSGSFRNIPGTREHEKRPLICINVSRHRTYLIDNEIRPIHATLYRAMPVIRHSDAAEINRMHREKSLAPDTTKHLLLFSSGSRGISLIGFASTTISWRPSRSPTSTQSILWTNQLIVWEKRQYSSHSRPAQGDCRLRSMRLATAKQRLLLIMAYTGLQESPLVWKCSADFSGSDVCHLFLCTLEY